MKITYKTFCDLVRSAAIMRVICPNEGVSRYLPIFETNFSFDDFRECFGFSSVIQDAKTLIHDSLLEQIKKNGLFLNEQGQMFYEEKDEVICMFILTFYDKFLQDKAKLLEDKHAFN